MACLRSTPTRQPLSAQFTDNCRWLLLWLPLVPIATGLAAGILFDRYYPAPWPIHLAPFACAAVLLLLARRGPLAAPLAVAALFLAAASVGALRHQVTFWRIGPNHVLTFLETEGQFARLRGRILTEPTTRTSQPSDYNIPTANRPHTSFTLAAEQILTPAGWTACDGLLRVGVRGAADHIRTGDPIEIYAALHTIEAPHNPGQYDWRLYNRRYGLCATASVAHPQSILPWKDAAAGQPFRRLINRFRQGCRAVLLDGIPADEPEAGLLATYVAGQRSAVSRQINDAFRRSGTSHLLAVSGSHVALIASAAGVAGILLLRRPRRAALLAFAAVVFFSLLVEPNAPALRSAVMAILAVTSLLLHRPFNVGNWLAGSAIVLLLITPAELFSPAFQMTFSAVIALVLLTRAICTLLFGPRDLVGWIRLQIRLANSPTRYGKTGLTLKNAFSYSFAAWLANFPLTMYHFGQLNPYGPIATVLITPLASLTLILGFSKLILGLLSPTLGELLAWPLAHLADWMARCAAWLGSWPGASLALPAPPAWLLIVFYIILLAWALITRRRWYQAWPMPQRRGFSARTIAPVAPTPYNQAGLVPIAEATAAPIYHPIKPRYVLAVAAALLSLYTLTAWPSAPDHPRVHVFSVGDGLCVLVRCPTGQNLLYDCGSLTESGVGEKIAVPALQALGVRQLDAVILSHGDLDHYNGLVDLARAIPVRHLWISQAIRQAAQQGPLRRLLQDLAALHVPIDAVAQGDTILSLGPITTTILWPPSQANLASLESNDTCLVVRIDGAGQRILLPGDLGSFAQTRLASEDPSAIRADILLLPHHGSTKTLVPSFIQAVQPHVAIASTVDPQRAPYAVSFCPPGAITLDTASLGMVTVDLLPTGPRVTTFQPDPAQPFGQPLSALPGQP